MWVKYGTEQKGTGKRTCKKTGSSACEMAKAPQCFCLKDIYEAHLKAKADHKNDFIDSADLMQHYGYPLHSVEGPSENIKITTPVDFYVFRALIDAKENLQILGL